MKLSKDHMRRWNKTRNVNEGRRAMLAVPLVLMPIAAAVGDVRVATTFFLALAGKGGRHLRKSLDFHREIGDNTLMKKQTNFKTILARVNEMSLPYRIVTYMLLPFAMVLGAVVGILDIPFSLVRSLGRRGVDYKAAFFGHRDLALKSRELELANMKLAHRLRSRRTK